MIIDPIQILLIFVITTLTVLLVLIGLQIVNILKEVRSSLEKINKILDDAGTISESIAKPVSDFAGFFKMAGLLVDFIKEKKKPREEVAEVEEEVEEIEEENSANPRPKKPRRRFFIKKGKKLA